MLLTDDQDIDKLISRFDLDIICTYDYYLIVHILAYRVDFYESCVDQLKREIPKYVGKLSGL